MAPKNLPFIYKFFLLYWEPFFAFSGALTALFDPAYLVRVLSPASTYDPADAMLFEQMAGSWLSLAFLFAVVLRCIDDLPTFKVAVMAAMVSDVSNAISIVHTLGVGFMLSPWRWRMDDWINVILSYPQVVVKIALFLNVGIEESKVVRKRK